MLKVKDIVRFVGPKFDLPFIFLNLFAKSMKFFKCVFLFSKQMLQFFFLKNTSMPKSTTLISNPIMTNQYAHEMEHSSLAKESFHFHISGHSYKRKDYLCSKTPLTMSF